MKNSLRAVVTVVGCCALALAGCTTSSGVMGSTGGAYTITKSGKSGFIPLGTLRKEAYDDARRFAESKGMEAEVIAVNEVPAGFARWPQVDLRFRLVRPVTARSEEKASMLVASQASHDALGNRTGTETRVTVGRQEDFYSELKKLGELREQGLLTEAEFQKEKKRLLDARDK